MKNEPWIDRVYKDNLQTREIKLDYTHWLQAEKLIVEQERQKKKRRFLFWLLMAGVVSIISFGSFLFLKPINSNEIQTATPPSEKLIPETENEHHLSPDTIKASSTPITQVDEIIFDLAHKQHQPVSKTDEIKLYNKKSQRNSNYIQRTVSTQPNLDNGIATNNIRDQLIGGKMNRINEIPDGINEENRSNNAQLELNGNQGIESSALPVHFKFDLATIEKKFGLLNYRNRQFRLNDGQFDDLRPTKVQPRKWAEKGVRTTLAQESNTGNTGTAISQAGLELYYHRSINKSIFYGLSAGYLSNFNKVHYAQVLTEYKYQGFGAQVNNYGIKPIWLQYGFIQVSGGMEWKKHRLMMGARPEFLIATKGKLDQIEFSDPTTTKTLKNAHISSLNQGWLQNDIMNKISVTAYLAYEFRIMEKIGLGIQLNHIVKSPYKPLQDGIVQNRQANWNTGFRLSYILK